MIGAFAAASVFLSLQGHGWNQEACWAGAVATICAFWWIFEPIPIPATSLIPIGLLPLFGVLTPKEIGQSYGSPMDWAATTPTASPFWTILPVERFLP